jgi:hypothetical protein
MPPKARQGTVPPVDRTRRTDGEEGELIGEEQEEGVTPQDLQRQLVLQIVYGRREYSVERVFHVFHLASLRLCRRSSKAIVQRWLSIKVAGPTF